MEKFKKYFGLVMSGAVIGAVNALFGAGGGMLTVPRLKKLGMSQKEAQANAISVIFPITVLSAALYLFRGDVKFSDVYIYLPTGIIGAIVGTVFLKKISSVWLKRIFGAFMIYAGVRLIMR